ncbi:RES family NAD+ phosphorylase [Gordonia sp. LSe1-13]|uniref:RES family NAD+ phosphorylase n=1 Tax=Gordonia sesuvii TaxID=3116777 RepID=A0ABU7ME04_9ACTN|nr:RES family NAD+ phosphorylase [Gordonia sp. LSe1-13]
MLPDPPDPGDLRALGLRDDEVRVIRVDEVWWRVHRTIGDHVLAWNALRTYGPVLRFDPHHLPRGEDPDGRGVWYGAETPDAALAEAFQADRTIDRGRERPYLTGLSFTRPITVIDIAADSSGAWATRAGGTYALSTGGHRITQRWARHIVEAHPNIDGLRYNSRFAGTPCLALFTPASTAMPSRPQLSLPLTHPDLAGRIASAARRLGYGVV